MSARADYPVGYGRPPEHTRFAKGVSGNPAGRPTGTKNLKAIIRDSLTGPIAMREGDRIRRVPIVEAIVMKQIENGLKGNDKAAFALIKIAAQVGLLADAGTGPEIKLTREEQAIMGEILQGKEQTPDET